MVVVTLWEELAADDPRRPAFAYAADVITARIATAERALARELGRRRCGDVRALDVLGGTTVLDKSSQLCCSRIFLPFAYNLFVLFCIFVSDSFGGHRFFLLCQLAALGHLSDGIFMDRDSRRFLYDLPQHSFSNYEALLRDRLNSSDAKSMSKYRTNNVSHVTCIYRIYCQLIRGFLMFPMRVGRNIVWGSSL